ncbi:MarR family winged helix-turn-helix transcriptional regulator [Roseiarcaceae bacterium H3SJ34-1]|uniref:MarR family winged helix-turn-helix transcriptional regulator n=1 Tax=Terripilifer ovatus TaxID=3032367 RepID=UPI003AB9276B|nr:MarR family winged helix-turn-helix transcriptional regulator [Roseiarcaceae bacterium H3SJ34-1]
MTDGSNIISLGGGIDTIPSKLLSAANFWRRSGNFYYRRHFRISITDVRILTFLQARGPVSLNAMADHCGIDKTQASRAVKELIGRKLVVHNRSAANGPVGLSLAHDGVRMCRKLKPASQARQKFLAAGFSGAEIDQLDRMLDVMLGNARASLVADADSRPVKQARRKRP